MLTALAHDVLTRQPAGYLAHIDRSSAASTFRAEQASDLTNLAAVPFASWTYRIEAVDHDAGPTAAATKRLGAPAMIAEVSLAYALPGVDVVPSTHDLWLTFDQRGGTTYLAGDSDLADAGFPSWVGPWRYGKLGVATAASSIVLGPAGEPTLLQALATEVDAAIGQVRAVVGSVVSIPSVWPGKVAVIVPSTAQEFGALLGTAGTTYTDISAAAVTDGIDPITQHAYGQRLVLNPTTLDALTVVGRQIVLRHEITHLATATITADTTPRWLVEGFAEYVGNLGTGQQVTTAAQELRADVRAGHLPTALPTSASFGATGAALAAVYEQSWLACRLIAATIGQAGLASFYSQVGQALEPGDAAVTDGLRSLLHESVATFTGRWRNYVQTLLS